MLVRKLRAPILVSGVVAILVGGLVPLSGGSAATAAPSATADCSQQTRANGTTPRRLGWQGETSALVSAPSVTVWMAGDSTMSNPSGACPVGWGSQFGPYFTSDVKVVNSAVAGRSIQTWLYDPNVTAAKDASGECVISPRKYSDRWQAMLDGMKSGDYLFVQFGINDGSSTCARHVGSARYRELLGMMAAEAKRRGAQPIFLTPTAAITCSGTTAQGNRGFLTETFAAGTATGVPVIDLHKLSYTLYNTLRLCPNNGDYRSGPVGAFFCDDHTHFEAEGARQIAGLVAKALRDQNIGLALYLR
jgi:lysophospholipase L1-like esterase